MQTVIKKCLSVFILTPMSLLCELKAKGFVKFDGIAGKSHL